MTKPHKRLSLLGASQSRRVHDSDVRLPMVEALRNFVPGGDGCPTLRNDFSYNTDRLMTVINAGAGGLKATDSDEHMVAIVEARNGQTAWFSRHFAFQTTGGTATIKNSTYTTGTISTSGSTVTGTSTAWMQNAWPGCLLKINGNTSVYRIATVTADGTMTTDSSIGTTAGGTSYILYQVHNGNDAEYPLHVEQWGDRLIYNVESPEPPVVEASVSGPFTNQVTQGSEFGEWLYTGAPAAPQAWGNGYIVTTKYTRTYWASEEGSTWTASNLGTNARAVCYSTSLSKFVAIDQNNDVYQDADGTGATWTLQGDNTVAAASGPLLAEDGAGRFVVVVTNGASYTDDITGAWTSVAISLLYPRELVFDGTNFIVVGALGTILTSADGATWATRTSGVDGLNAVGADGAGNVVAVANSGYIILSTDSGATWATQTPPDGYESVDFRSVRWSGSYFVVAGIGTNAKCLIKSADGVTWEAIDISSLPDVGDGLEDCIPDDANVTKITVFGYWGLRGSYYGTLQTPSGTEFGTFAPLSTEIRSKTFTVAGSYLMLGCTREWNDTSDTWVYYPRRVRWPSPGTTADFEGEGAGWLDLPGVGEILALRAAGPNVLGFDTSGVFALEQLGDLDVPWGYRRLRSGIQVMSNVISVGTQAFWVAHDGKIWTSNGVQVEPWGQFDIAEFDEWIADESKPIHIAWYPGLNALAVFRRTESTTDGRVWLITEDQRISYITVPIWTDNATTRVPLSMFVSDNNDPKLYVGYDANKNVDTNHLVTLYLQKGQYIKGLDSITSAISARWYAQLQTGYDRLTEDGQMVKVSAVELYGYAGYTGKTSSGTRSYMPYVGIQMRTQDETSWFSPGTTTGTITVGTNAGTTSGSGTALSNLIAAGDNTSTVFTLPCLATQARVYRETSGTYTLQALTTNYTITGTKQITLTAVLATGTNLYAYWDGEPLVKTEVGDLLLTTSAVHRILTIPTATSLTVDPYLSTGTATGTHVPAEIMSDEEGSTVHGIGHRGDDVQFRITMMPQNNNAAPASVRLNAMLVEYQPLEAQEKRKD